MREVANAEDQTEKAAVTPGPIAPARELLGEMLLETGDGRAAQTEFEATLRKEPNRFRALYGAGRASEQAGDRAAATRHFAALLAMCSRAATPERPEIQHARAAVAR